MDVNYNQAHLADVFSSTPSTSSDFPGAYYKYVATLMAEYSNTLTFDKRNIATGGTDMDIYPWESKADLTEAQQKVYAIPQVFQDLIYQIKKPNNVLFTGSDYSHVRIIQCFEQFKSKITILNNLRLDYFEKCVKPVNHRFSQVYYEVLSMQDFVAGTSSKFDLIELWANQIDMAFSDVSQYTNLLESSGILLICGTADWSFLYENETSGHPMYDLHEQLKFDDSVYTFHVPLHYGFTVVTKK
jgi:hypothetical protein